MEIENAPPQVTDFYFTICSIILVTLLRLCSLFNFDKEFLRRKNEYA